MAVRRRIVLPAWRPKGLLGLWLLAHSGVAHQVVLDIKEEHEGGIVFEPPAFQLHLVTAAMGLVPHTAYVERFPGPYPFVLDAGFPGAKA